MLKFDILLEKVSPFIRERGQHGSILHQRISRAGRLIITLRFLSQGMSFVTFLIFPLTNRLISQNFPYFFASTLVMAFFSATANHAFSRPPFSLCSLQVESHNIGKHLTLSTKSSVFKVILYYSTPGRRRTARLEFLDFFENMPGWKLRTRFGKTWLYGAFWVQNLCIALLS